MSESTEDSPSPKKKHKKRLFGVSTIIAAVVALPLTFLTVHLARGWFKASARLNALTTEQALLMKNNAVLSRAFEATQMQRFQVCNKTPGDNLDIPWLAAVYHDGQQLKLFDASRCRDWRRVQLGNGDTRSFTLSSPQEGCNWNGSVLLYAMHFAREAEDQTSDFKLAGPWRGFDRDCFTVQ